MPLEADDSLAFDSGVGGGGTQGEKGNTAGAGDVGWERLGMAMGWLVGTDRLGKCGWLEMTGSSRATSSAIKRAGRVVCGVSGR